MGWKWPRQNSLPFFCGNLYLAEGSVSHQAGTYLQCYCFPQHTWLLPESSSRKYSSNYGSVSVTKFYHYHYHHFNYHHCHSFQLPTNLSDHWPFDMFYPQKTSKKFSKNFRKKFSDFVMNVPLYSVVNVLESKKVVSLAKLQHDFTWNRKIKPFRWHFLLTTSRNIKSKKKLSKCWWNSFS